jgi:hypothetical protein
MIAAMLAAFTPFTWAAIAVAAVGILALLAIRYRALDRLGSRLAGEPKARREALARTGTTDGATKVARFAAMLADPQEVRLIRWTPARTSDGLRIALGASPAAWYLWLPEPSVLVRVPDCLVARAEHVDVGDGVAELHCEMRDGDGVVAATDGVTIEEAENSPALAKTLLHGLVFVDPSRRQEPKVEPVAEPAAQRTAPAGAKVSLAS